MAVCLPGASALAGSSCPNLPKLQRSLPQGWALATYFRQALFLSLTSPGCYPVYATFPDSHPPLSSPGASCLCGSEDTRHRLSRLFRGSDSSSKLHWEPQREQEARLGCSEPSTGSGTYSGIPECLLSGRPEPTGTSYLCVGYGEQGGREQTGTALLFVRDSQVTSE